MPPLLLALPLCSPRPASSQLPLPPPPQPFTSCVAGAGPSTLVANPQWHPHKQHPSSTAAQHHHTQHQHLPASSPPSASSPQELHAAPPLRGDAAASSMSERRIMHAFASSDADICAHSSPSTILGTTATVAVIVPGGGALDAQPAPLPSLFVAHVGDSRALLVTRAAARFLTQDHVPTRQDEAERIHRAGGGVFKGRVNGVLAVSRALGDMSLKSAVISTPDVVELQLSPQDCCLLLATDGLWDFVDEHDVYKLLSSDSATHSMSNLAKLLADMAVDRGATDDISVVLIDLAAHAKRP
jgi:serine/threonine protein phosphatase PrpC